MDRLDIGGVVAEKIVVKNDTTRLLVCYDYVANLEEDPLDLGVVVIKSLGAIDCARALVNLKNIQELPDQLLTLIHQVLFIQMDTEVVSTLEDLETNDIGSLLLVKVLSEDISTLCVSLTPLFSLSIKKLQT